MTDERLTIPNLSVPLALEYWREAAANEVGCRFAIRLADMEKIKNLMYAARQGHDELSDLMLCVAPGGEEIWLVKRPQEAP